VLKHIASFWHAHGLARPWKHRRGLSGAVLPIICGALLAACGSGAQNQPSGAQTQPSVTYPIGNLTPTKGAKGEPVVQDDGLTITLLDAQCSDIAVNTPNHFLVGFNVAVNNPGTNEIPILRSSQIFANADGTVQADGDWTLPGRTIGDRSFPSAFQPLMSESNFAPGATVTGWLVFALPRPKAFAELYFKPDVMTEGGGTVWDVPCGS
jgi:hypothetical protein